MRIVFLGLSLSSSWGNGHATTYRSLLKGLYASGHDVLFLEREQPWYAANRDLPNPDFCQLQIYQSLAGLHSHLEAIALADAVIVGSYVPDGAAVIEWVNKYRSGLLCFYDIDTPITLQGLAGEDIAYLTPRLVPQFDLYLSFTGGPTLQVLQDAYHARRAVAFYCSVDPELYQPVSGTHHWDLGYLGTYSADRQDALERLLLEPARRLPDQRFVVAGPQYPSDIIWPSNVDRINHLPPSGHAGFYCSQGWTLNLTRRDMLTSGYSPSVRLFEATACGVAVMSDRWAGIEDVLQPGKDLLMLDDTSDVIEALLMSNERRVAIGTAGQTTTLLNHTGRKRAEELVQHLAAARF